MLKSSSRKVWSLCPDRGAGRFPGSGVQARRKVRKKGPREDMEGWGDRLRPWGRSNGDSEAASWLGHRGEEETLPGQASSPGDPWSEVGRRVVSMGRWGHGLGSPRGAKGSILCCFKLVSSEVNPKKKIQGSDTRWHWQGTREV